MVNFAQRIDLLKACTVARSIIADQRSYWEKVAGKIQKRFENARRIYWPPSG